MKKLALTLGLLVLSIAPFVQPVSQASAAAPASTVVLSDSTPTVTIGSGTDTAVIHRTYVTVAPGTKVNVVLLGKPLPGYQWNVTYVTAQCLDANAVRTPGNGLIACGDKTVIPGGPPPAPGEGVLLPGGGTSGSGYEFTQKDPVLAPGAQQFEAIIQTPNVATFVTVDYALYPPMQPGQQVNSPIKIYQVVVVVEPEFP